MIYLVVVVEVANHYWLANSTIVKDINHSRQLLCIYFSKF